MKEKMSTLKFWNKTNEKQQSDQDAKTDAKNAKNGRNWLHAPEALTNGHVAYLVKFLGSTPVEQPKGIEVVKEAIRRLQFTQQVKKAENGSNVKMKKLEITVSIDGVAIQEPRTNNILHQFPLHKISYCADEKGVKKFFSFIAKSGGSNNGTNTPSLTNGDSNSINTSSSSSTTGTSDETHECFVFISNKLASDITLTIGQAFDLAYRRYMSDSGKQFEISKLQSHNKHLENTVAVYRQRLRDMSEIMPKSDLDRLLIRLGLRDICEVPPEIGNDPNANGINGSKTPDLGIDVSAPNNDDQLLIETSPKHFAPIVPPRNLQSQINNTIDALKPSVGTKLEGLLLNSDSDSDFDPRADENEMMNSNKITNDLFGFEPPKSMGQQLFSAGSLTNGSLNGSSGFQGPPISPPPLLAPPPKAGTPRRNGTTTNSTMNGKADLFGSDPFAPVKPFDASQVSLNESSGFFDGSNSAFNPFNGSSATHTEFSPNSSMLEKVEGNNTIQSQPHSQSQLHTVSSAPVIQNPFSHNKFNTSASANDLEVMNVVQSELSGFSSGISSPDMTTSKYDIFKDTTDFSAFSDQISNPSPPPPQPKPEVSKDLFKDFAMAAFNEFKDKNPPHEFTNQFIRKISTQSSTNATVTSTKFGDFNQNQSKNSFKNGFNPDDFTLESLDPLK